MNNIVIIQKDFRAPTYSLHFILRSKEFPNGKDKLSAGGWGTNSKNISFKLPFKLELVL